MDAVKRYIFWIVIAAALVIASGAYLLIVPGVQEATKTLHDKNETKRTEVANLAKNPKEIKNANYVQAADQYKKHLDTERAQILDLLKDKKFVLDEKFKKAPEDIQIQFDQWLKDTRQEILTMAEKGGLRLPSDFAVQQMFEGKKTEDVVDREARILRLALIYELVRILSSTKTDVTRTGFEPEMGKSEPTERVQVGVESLDRLEILGEKDFAARLSGAAKKAWDLAKSGALYRDDAGPKPYKSAGLELRFTAPFASIPAVLQALENSNVFYGVNRKIDTQRTTMPYPTQEDISKFGVPRKDAPAGTRFYTYYQEAPLQVMVLLEMVSFDADGAKAILAPPVAPPPAKGAPKK